MCDFRSASFRRTPICFSSEKHFKYILRIYRFFIPPRFEISVLAIQYKMSESWKNTIHCRIPFSYPSMDETTTLWRPYENKRQPRSEDFQNSILFQISFTPLHSISMKFCRDKFGVIAKFCKHSFLLTMLYFYLLTTLI